MSSLQVTPTNSNPINPTLGTDSLASASSQLLGEGDFIKLLVTQMTSQDPMNPMNNQDMLTQMVQFSTLQGNTGLQSEFAKMQSSQELTQANALLGRQVSLLSDSGALAQGVVTGVSMDSGTAKIVVNGTAYDLSQVTSITAASPADAAAASANAPAAAQSARLPAPVIVSNPQS